MRLISIPVTLSLLLLFYCGSKIPGAGDRAPDFMLNDLETNRFYLSAQKGKAVLLNFWSVYCVPCQKEMPVLGKLREKYEPEKLVIAGICTDAAEPGYIETFVKDTKINYTVLLDPHQRVVKQYGVNTLPITLLIDKKGVVKHRWTGYEAGLEAEYYNQINNLLKNE